MPSVKTSIIINAPPSTVRAAWLDFPSFPSWNTFVTSVNPPTTNPTPGTALLITIYGSEEALEMVVKDNTPKRFSWTGHIGPRWVFKGHHFMDFEPYGSMGENGETVQCRLLSYEKFTGVLACFYILFFRKWTEDGYVAMNNDLKGKAEGIVGGL